jgi:ribose/xylose/arabinose/galactoside ABC-type transport system permease subunit
LINGTIVALFKVAPFVVTLWMLSVSHAIALMMTNGQPVVGMPAGFAYLGASYWGPVPIPVVIALGIFFICHFIWSKTTFGRDLYAVGGNPEAARLCGISIQSTIILSYLVMGFLTGIAGIVLTSRVKSGQPNLGLGMELEAIAAVVIGGVSLSGGKGSLFGVLCGAIIISFLRNGLNLLNVSSYVQMLVIGSVIVISAIISKVRSESSS